MVEHTARAFVIVVKEHFADWLFAHMIILCFYNALDFQLEIIFSFIIDEKIKKFCFLTNHEERLRKKFYLVMSGHSGFNFKKFLRILPTLRIKTKS